MPDPNLIDWIERARDAEKAAIDSIPADAVARIIDRLRAAYLEDRQVFAFGNGGSAANCSHFITDLGKGSSDKLQATGQARRFRCMSLNDNISWITALGNDYAYEDVYVGQLQNYAKPGDIAITVSVSGNSPNCVKALQWAKDHGLYTVALVGGKRGRLADIAHEPIVIQSTHYAHAEDAQMTILHMLCYAFMEMPEIAR